MRTYFMLKNFKEWLKTNRKRCSHPPFITRITKNGFSLSFSGIDPRICCYVSKSGMVSVSVKYDGECCDIIAEFDVIPNKDQRGKYFCYLCRIEDQSSQSYPSRSELVIIHTWEPLLEWISTKLSPSMWVCVYGTDGYSEAKLKEKLEVEHERMGKDFCGAFAAIRQSKPENQS
ncbi:MAG: hypothetical protein JZU65_23455 [Chlorobium sp.]|nr:hypothetical protein [Chlorobium sp.]